jgi:hypothetical protein
MNIQNTTRIKTLITATLLIFLFAFKSEKDPLHKRIFHVSLTEVKDGTPAKKSILDKFEFKDGKLFSDYFYDKFQYKWIRYRINKDSVFTDSTDTEVRLLEIEGSFTDEANQTVMMNFSIQEWDLDGTIKITKNDKIKKYYDIVGFEKGGKPKKIKKKKNPKDSLNLFELKKE